MGKIGEHIEEKEMSFLDHVEALRWHLVRAISVVFIFTIVAFLNKSFVFDTIILAPKNLDFFTYRALCKLSQLINIGDALCMIELPFQVINMSMSGQFTTHIIVSLIAGIIISSPYVIWEIWRFIKPGLYDSEKKYTSGVVFFSSLLFICGVLFGYFLIAPLSVNFLGSYSISAEVKNMIALTSYITTVSTITLGTGVIFELPIVVYFLSKLGILTPEIMKAYRKHALVVILIVAAIITPPDVSSQVLVAIPILFLYQISIYISKMVVKKANL